VIGGDGELGSLERLGHDVERLVLAICLAGSGVLGGLALLVVFLVFVLAAADTGIPNTSVAGVAGLAPVPTGLGTGASVVGRIAPEPIDGISAVTTAGGGLVPGWADRPALNQYACANYRSAATCQQWAAADCSAAALDWLLGAYGVRLGGIDDAVGLIGPGSGISTAVGLLDSSGSRLAAAVASQGLRPRRAQLHSSDELRTWLVQGPVLLDGHQWFGVGHWFVAIASDAAGVFIRDSSGFDTRYLSWTRLFGEVGWSGWAVGVQSAQGGPPA